MPEEPYTNIRDILGAFVGKRIEDISQHDEEEFKETGESYIMLLIEGGDYLKFPIGDGGFSYSEDTKDESET